jgi:competence protein ComEC
MHVSFYKRPLFIVLVIYALFLALFLKVPSAAPADILQVQKAKIEALVTSYPRSKKETKLFEAKIVNVDGNAGGFKAYVYCKNCPDVARGQKLVLTGEISPIKEVDNFGSFNWAEFLARKHIFSRINTEQVDSIETGSNFWVKISAVRSSLLSVFGSNFDASLSHILAGITLGEKGDIDQALYTAFQDSGAMHLLVASGGNIGFITLIVYFICSLFGAGRKVSAALALVLAALYTLIAGADAPLIRAYLMTLSVTIGFILGRKSGALQGFIVAAFLILAFYPQSLFEAGFQMSFLATLAIILMASNFKFNFKIHSIAKWVSQLFFVSFAAQLALMPVFTNYFHKVSFTAALSNIILVPLSGLIMGGGFLVWLLSFIPVDFIFEPAVFGLKTLLIIFKFLVEFFAGFKISKVAAPSLSAPSVIVYFILLFGFLNLPIIKHKIRYCLFWGFIVFVVLFFGIFSGRDSLHILEDRYNKALVASERGKVIALGAGVQGDILKRAVLASGETKIECLFLSGVGKGGVYALNDLEGIEVKNIYFPYSDIPKETQELLLRLSAKGEMLWPGDERCGVKAVNPWYISAEGKIFTGSGDNLSYIYKDYNTAGSMKEIITKAEMEAWYGAPQLLHANSSKNLF